MSLILRSSAPTLTRPANTTAYAVGDLVANSTTAAQVTNRLFSFERFSGHLAIWAATIEKSKSDETNADFLLHLFESAPTYTSAGDNSALSTVLVASAKSYIGTLSCADMYAASDVTFGRASRVIGTTPIIWNPAFSIQGADEIDLYGVLVANGAYTPASGETFDLTLYGTVEHQQA